MPLSLEAIQFNHHSGSATTDAFSIRKNETEPIATPEWQRGFLTADQSVAAYARNLKNPPITIKARFTCTDHSITSIEVQALDGHAPGGGGDPLSIANVLGRVKKTTVLLIEGESGFVPFDLEEVLIATAGVSRSETIWKWQFRINSNDSFTDLVTTNHKIYTVLDLPTAPWQPLSPEDQNTQLPWTEVLDVAYEWAAGAQNIDAAAEAVTRGVSDLGEAALGVIYRYDPSYVVLRAKNFDCTRFLELVGGRQGNGPYVNCFDCATAVSSFSNVLGANLWQSKMGYNFFVNHILRIGKPPVDDGDFMRHEVAWTGGATKTDNVFDACFKLDGDSTPGPESPEHFDPLLAVNLRFGERADEQYRFRIEAVVAGAGACKARPATKQRRIIGVSPLMLSRNTQTELNILSRHYRFKEWKKTRESNKHLLIWRFFLSGSEVAGWKAERIRRFNTSGKMPALSQAFWTNGDYSPEVQFWVDAFECDSLPAAHSFLLEVLGESHLLNMKRLGEGEAAMFGDVAFSDPDGTAVFFSRANIVLAIRNAGREQILVQEFAQRFDIGLKSRPDGDGKIIEEMKHFRFPDYQFRVGEQIPIEFLSNDVAEAQLLYKFFSESGEIFLRNQRATYEPMHEGQQQVVVFGVDAQQNARMQKLDIFIKD